MAWLTLNTLAVKVVTVLGQIALAWLLMPEDFGLIGLAYTVTAFTGIVRGNTITNVLIARSARFDLWSNPGFWMSVASGLLAACTIVLLSPVAAWAYDSNRLHGLLYVLAGAALFEALLSVPVARLRASLRFKLIAVCQTSIDTFKMVLTVALAALGFGTYSFVIPALAGAILLFVIYWSLARPKIKWHPEFRRWRWLLSDTLALVGMQFFIVILWQGGYIMLGLFHEAAEVGLYFFAFRLSLQTLMLFSDNLTKVLFASLSTLQDDPARQTKAYLNSVRLIGPLAAGVCILQAVVADPLISLIFDDRWQGAIPILQILSVGMAIRVVAFPTGSFIQSQRRFWTVMWLQGGSAFNYLVFCGLAAWLSGPLGVAVAAMLHFMIVAPVYVCVAIFPNGYGMMDVVKLYFPAVTLGLVSAACGFGTNALLMQLGLHHPLWHILLPIVTCGLGCLAVMQYVMPNERQRLYGMLRRAPGARYILRAHA
ncbi:oligosaccharide flippase family protein [Mucisphaera sp.]|uniref:oligosaccharide flippase family protein n=1 Tax=Mucisphaera sp. TaxID=2913024 RepID=UPI003D0BFECD